MIRFARSIVGAAVAGAALLGVGSGRADAAFTYVSTGNPPITTIGGTIITLGSVTSVTPQNGQTLINGLNVGFQTSTVPPATDTGSFNFLNPIVITPSAGATVTLTPNDTLTISRSDTGGQVSVAMANNLPVTGTNGVFTYTITQIQYAGPTINNSGAGVGNISYLITETPTANTPEPGTLGMAAVGGLFGLGYVARRRRVG